MKRMTETVRARLNLLIATALAFGFGLGLASALDLTPLSVAAEDRRAPELVIGARGNAEFTMNGGFADMLEGVAPAVVTVYAQGVQEVARTRFPPDFELPPGFEEFDPRRRDRDPEEGEADDDEPATRLVPWSGSGFIISTDGYVLTNNHVVAGADRIDLELADRRVFEDVEVVGRDPQTDVALLKIDAGGLPVTPLGTSEDTRVGEWVLAIGSPGFSNAGTGPLETTVTAGIVSAKGRNIDILRRSGESLAIEDFVQTDAVINRGNSGGPLVNAAGEVIGINTAIASTSGTYQGYGFAVPIELAREVIDDLIEFGQVRRALIGVGINDVTSADARFYELDRVAGAKVGSFSFGDDSPAARAGIELGDVIIGVAGEPVEGVSDLQRRIRSYEPGETVELDIVRRATRAHEVARVTLIGAEQPEPVETASRRLVEEELELDDPLGIEVSEISRSLAREYGIPSEIEGVVIVGGEARGPVGRMFNGLIPEGFVLTDINAVPITSVEDYERVVGELGPGDVASMILQAMIGGTWQTQIRSLALPPR